MYSVLSYNDTPAYSSILVSDHPLLSGRLQGRIQDFFQEGVH